MSINYVRLQPTDHHSPVTQLLMTRPRDEWRHDVTSRYRALEQFSKEDARLQFLRILRSLPYGTPHTDYILTVGHMLPALP